MDRNTRRIRAFFATPLIITTLTTAGCTQTPSPSPSETTPSTPAATSTGAPAKPTEPSAALKKLQADAQKWADTADVVFVAQASRQFPIMESYPARTTVELNVIDRWFGEIDDKTALDYSLTDDKNLIRAGGVYVIFAEKSVYPNSSVPTPLIIKKADTGVIYTKAGYVLDGAGSDNKVVPTNELKAWFLNSLK